MAGYRTLVERKPVDDEFLITLIDHVRLPALRGTPRRILNLRDDAREALQFYRSVFGDELAVVTYQDAANVQYPPEHGMGSRQACLLRVAPRRHRS